VQYSASLHILASLKVCQFFFLIKNYVSSQNQIKTKGVFKKIISIVHNTLLCFNITHQTTQPSSFFFALIEWKCLVWPKLTKQEKPYIRGPKNKFYIWNLNFHWQYFLLRKIYYKYIPKVQQVHDMYYSFWFKDFMHLFIVLWHHLDLKVCVWVYPCWDLSYYHIYIVRVRCSHHIFLTTQVMICCSLWSKDGYAIVELKSTCIMIMWTCAIYLT